MSLKQNKYINFSQDLRAIITGVFAWILLSFASLKLSVIYSLNPGISYLLTYNISSIIFLIYFYAYLKSKFNFKMLILLFVSYNIGIHLFELIYKELFIIYKSELNLTIIFVSVFLNLVIMLIIYFILRKLIKYSKL